MLFFAKIIDKISQYLAILGGIVTLILLLSNVYAVIMRYIFNNPLHWPLDFSEFLLVGIVFLGGAYTLQVDGHVNISIFFMNFSEKTQTVFKMMWFVIIGIFSSVLLWKSWLLAWENLYAHTSSMSFLPTFPSYIIVPIGSFMLLLQTLSKIITEIISPGRS